MEKKSSYLPTTTPTPPPPRSSEQEQSPSKRKRRPQGEETLSPFWKAVRNVLLFLAAIVNLGVSVWVVVEHGNLPELFPGQHDNLDAGKKTCHLPDLMPLSPEMRALMSEPTRIDCLSIANSDFRGRIFFKLDEEQRLIKREGVSIPCCYRPFYRVNDVENWIEPTKDRRYVCHNITEQVTIIPSRIEFIEVICDDGRSSYKDAFAFLRKKPEVEERIENLAKKEKEADPYGPEVEKLNLLVIGLDSTSQQNFIRRMPKSLEYVTTTLDAVRLDGYVKVGENTLPNLVPLLTGIGLEEFRELCVMKNPPMESAIHLDDCPFIWKQFQAAGYRTVYAEDEVSTGIFNLVFSHAFQQPPTDHYFRPFSVRMVTSQNVYDGFCMGPRMGIQVLFDYLEKAARTYSSPTDHLFHFTWASKLMHDDFNKLGWADGHLLRTLKTLNELGTCINQLT
ncbi:hypothetical protein Fcan01_14295 [Folsomia candida]|uniref:Uncharacterized protein n=1 Tax=Folsomia candida TaxID=158441 RepID=A0A226E0Q8_FOLCA|nr:hypothetical protein Fcan01_14295 [Folsomia candida]